jgi:hypothetical protein
LLCAAVSFVALCGAAAAKAHQKTSPDVQLATVASKFTRVGTGELLGDQRYVLIFGANDSGVLTDTQTGKTTAVSEPGCSWAIAVGDSSIVFGCDQSTSTSYELYSTTTGRSTQLSLNPSVAANATVTAVGADWLALAVSCGEEHCGPSQFDYQNLADGSIAPDPSGGSTTVDLDSPTLRQTLCSPLTVPSPSSGPVDHYGAPSILLDGRFAVFTGPGGSYLEQCGSELHQFLTYTSYPGCAHQTCPPPANSNLIIWESAPLRLSGIFLPDRQRFTIPLPDEIDPTPGPYVNGDQYALALTSHTLYVGNDDKVWMAPAPGSLTVTSSSLGGLTRGNPRLGLAASTPAHSPQIMSLAITLPSGLSFAEDRKALKSNVNVNGSKPRLATRATRILVLRFQHAVAKTKLVIRPGALVESSQMLAATKRKRNSQVRVTLAATETNGTQISTSLPFHIK